ncbi:hypothetical protein LTR27_010681 [Elasticomyces elasticus]|nr:hypothetical protein LTR27_010681 [Elasticomyces elasticus]
MADKLRTQQQLEALQNKYIGTGHADTTKHEWTSNIARDSYGNGEDEDEVHGGDGVALRAGASDRGVTVASWKRMSEGSIINGMTFDKSVAKAAKDPLMSNAANRKRTTLDSGTRAAFQMFWMKQAAARLYYWGGRASRRTSKLLWSSNNLPEIITNCFDRESH